MIEKILKIDFQNFYIHEMSQKVYHGHFSVLHNETTVKYGFHQIV